MYESMQLPPSPTLTSQFLFQPRYCKRKKWRNLFMVICLLRLENSFIHNCRLRTKIEKGKRNRISRTFFNQCADCFICYRLFCCCCFAVVIAPSFSSSVAICFPHSIYDESFFNFCTGFVRFYSFFFWSKWRIFQWSI